VAFFSVIHSQVVQATGNLHGYIGEICFLVPKDVFNNPAALHSGDGMFHADSELRQLLVSGLLGSR
jgi:hypothetical protein